MANIEPALPRRQLGRYMRELRNQANLTLQDAAKLVQWSPSMLQRLEAGKLAEPREVDIRALCKVYDSDDGTTEAMVNLGHQANEKSWWHEYTGVMRRGFDVYVGLEAVAESLAIHQPELVPGLFQTNDYARAVISARLSPISAAEIDQKVQFRLRRQKAILRTTRPTRVAAVIGEAGLRRVMGGSRIMAAQMRRLDELMTKDHISISILPFSAGCPAGEPLSSFVMLDFGQDAKGRPASPPFIYQEGYTGELYQETDTAVRQYQEAFEALRNSALNTHQGRNLIRQLTREYERAA
ncbi:helix-turn-helix domain-containing protein [Nocardia sp. NPDC056611]|uniref:helix-turn-helix domain-containing protein n=1 Tax=Nocardia sp. NPDC056611 TaxID=3345877 RepID=UPI00366C96E6